MVATQPRLRSPLNPLNVTSYGLFSSSSSSSRICASSNRVIYRSLDPPTFSILSVETLENVFARRGTATIPPPPFFPPVLWRFGRLLWWIHGEVSGISRGISWRVNGLLSIVGRIIRGRGRGFIWRKIFLAVADLKIVRIILFFDG